MPDDFPGQTLIPMPPEHRIFDSPAIRLLAVSVALLLFAVTIAIALRVPTPTATLNFIMLVLASLGAGIASFLIIGSITTGGSVGGLPVKAGGGFAIFVLVLSVGLLYLKPTQFVMLDGSGIEKLFSNKTVVHPIRSNDKRSLEFHSADKSLEIKRYSGEEETGTWSVRDDGSAGIIKYVYLKNGANVTTCEANVIYNAASNRVLLHEIRGSCGNSFVTLVDGRQLQ